MPNFRGVGREAEDAAAEYLLGKGYTILTRRFCVRGGEIDLVTLDGETLVFVEVKQRLAKGFVPEESVSKKKLESLRRAAGKFLHQFPQERAWRFDFIAIDADGLRHYEGVFTD